MPHKFETDHQHLPADKDRRRKLTEEQKQEIASIYQGGDSSLQKLALEYGVSKRTIHFIVNPEALAANKQRRQERGGWQQYYDKDQHREAMKEHRRYKKRVLA